MSGAGDDDMGARIRAAAGRLPEPGRSASALPAAQRAALREERARLGLAPRADLAAIGDGGADAGAGTARDPVTWPAEDINTRIRRAARRAAQGADEEG
jgi:hypothetical protein